EGASEEWARNYGLEALAVRKPVHFVRIAGGQQFLNSAILPVGSWPIMWLNRCHTFIEVTTHALRARGLSFSKEPRLVNGRFEYPLSVGDRMSMSREDQRAMGCPYALAIHHTLPFETLATFADAASKDRGSSGVALVVAAGDVGIEPPRSHTEQLGVDIALVPFGTFDISGKDTAATTQHPHVHFDAKGITITTFNAQKRLPGRPFGEDQTEYDWLSLHMVTASLAKAHAGGVLPAMIISADADVPVGVVVRAMDTVRAERPKAALSSPKALFEATVNESRPFVEQLLLSRRKPPVRGE
ncbi:MAG: hypothetical protein MK101_12610, partial [Phycisphaerales bacterium]|nr:hypothetical protein [Phycisphaerales bacterium]